MFRMNEVPNWLIDFQRMIVFLEATEAATADQKS